MYHCCLDHSYLGENVSRFLSRRTTSYFSVRNIYIDISSITPYMMEHAFTLSSLNSETMLSSGAFEAGKACTTFRTKPDGALLS
jgi:hypothetical protein